MPTSTQLAYLAGMIDADGFITISRVRKANKGRCAPALYHSLQVGIAGTERGPHDLAASLFGGNTATYQPKNPRHKAQFQWSVCGPTAVHLLRGIKEYLVVKREQANIGLRFQELLDKQIATRKGLRPPYRITDEQRIEREGLCLAMQALNGWRRRKQKPQTTLARRMVSREILLQGLGSPTRMKHAAPA